VQWLFVAAGEAGHYEVLVYGMGFLLAVLFAPEGINGLIRRGWARLVPARKAAPAAVAAAEPPAPATAGRSGVCLRVDTVSKNFGGLQAVDTVSLEVPFGSIMALIGPNGAGKTTLYNILSGIEEPSSGRVLIEGTDMADVPPHRRARHVGRSFQVARLVPQMTVLENVAVRADQLGFAGETARLGAAGAQLAWFGLGDLAGRRAAELGSGYHKLVELARAAVGEPALLLLDEPAVGLAPDEIDRLCHFLTLLRERGAAILIVEHNVDLVARIAERIFVLNQGRIIADGTGPEVMANPKVREAYLGALE
jgi:branched-chain amino acid transport system permease protein